MKKEFFIIVIILVNITFLTNIIATTTVNTSNEVTSHPNVASSTKSGLFKDNSNKISQTNADLRSVVTSNTLSAFSLEGGPVVLYQDLDNNGVNDTLTYVQTISVRTPGFIGYQRCECFMKMYNDTLLESIPIAPYGSYDSGWFFIPKTGLYNITSSFGGKLLNEFGVYKSLTFTFTIDLYSTVFNGTKDLVKNFVTSNAITTIQQPYTWEKKAFPITTSSPIQNVLKNENTEMRTIGENFTWNQEIKVTNQNTQEYTNGTLYKKITALETDYILTNTTTVINNTVKEQTGIDGIGYEQNISQLLHPLPAFLIPKQMNTTDMLNYMIEQCLPTLYNVQVYKLNFTLEYGQINDNLYISVTLKQTPDTINYDPNGDNSLYIAYSLKEGMLTKYDVKIDNGFYHLRYTIESLYPVNQASKNANNTSKPLGNEEYLLLVPIVLGLVYYKRKLRKT